MTSTRTLLLPLAACVCLAILPVVPGARAASAFPQHAESDRSTLNLEFPGGNAAEFMAALKQAADKSLAEPPNLVVGAGLENIPVPPLSLTAVTVETAVDFLTTLPRTPGAQWFVRVNQIDNGGRAVLSVQADSATGARSGTRAPAAGSQELLVVSLRPITDGGMDHKAALSAIETALGLISDPSLPPKIRYHEETGILAVLGMGPELLTVQRVVDALEVSADSGSLKGRISELTLAKNALEQNLSKMTMEAQEQERLAANVQHELVNRMRDIDACQQQVAMMRDRVATSETEVETMKRDRDQLLREREHMLQEIEALRAKAADAQANRPK